MWAGVFLAEESAWRSGRAVSMVAAFGFAGLSLLALFTLRRRSSHAPLLVLCAVGLALGMAAGGLFWLRVDSNPGAMRSLAKGARVASLTDASASRFGYTVRLRVLTGPARGSAFTASLPAGVVPPLCGESLWVKGSPDTGEADDEWARRRHRSGDSCRASLWSAEPTSGVVLPLGLVAPARRRLVAAVERIEGDGGALLQGVLLGERNRLRGTPMETDFRTTGLSHVLAVSGTHLVIVAYLAGAFLLRTGMSRGWRTALILCFACCYVLLTGSPVSAVRSLLMAATAAIASISGRRGDALSALSVAVCLVLFLSPAQAFDIGFALSVSAVAGLIVFAPLATSWVSVLGGRRLAKPLRAIVAPVVAQAATAPIAIPVFNMVSLVGPLANVLVLPLATVGLGVGVVGGMAYLVWPGLGTPLLRLAALPLIAVGRLAGVLADLPYAAVPVGGSAMALGLLSAAGAGVLWAVWPEPRSRARATVFAVVGLLLCVFVAVGTTPIAGGSELIVLDVGQGDAILVRDGSRAVLIDTGPDQTAMRSAAARAGLRGIDAVFLSHPHADHTGGLAGLQGVVGVGAVFVPAATQGEFDSMNPLAEDLTGRPVQPLEAGATVELGQWSLEVLWPVEDGIEALSCNDTSMVLLARHASGFSAVLTGDAEVAAQAGIMRSSTQQIRCDLLKVPHHGSSGGLDPQILDLWRPGIAVVSVGTGNDFGHPHAQTMSQLEDSGIRVLRTDFVGDVKVKVGSKGFRISTDRSRDARGIRRPACATIAVAQTRVPYALASERISSNGNFRPVRSQARLPDLRLRGSVARAGHRSPQAAILRCRGP